MKICVITAMDKEFSLISGLDCIAGHEIIPAVSGIGKVNAAVNAAELIERCHPDCVVNTGVAGGIGKDVHMGDLVVATQCSYHDVWCGEGNEYGQVQGLPARFDSCPALLEASRSCRPAIATHYGLICSGDRFIEDEADDRAILSRFPDALACDMESAAIAQVCFRKSVPFFCMRIVSDCLADGGHMATYENFWKTVSDRSFAVVRSILCSFPDFI